MKYRRDIDGLRGIAVLLVLLSHAKLGFSGGFVGVDIFFVISGYIITKIVFEDIRNEKFKLVNFWLKRVRRLFPSIFVILFIVATVAWFVYLPSDLENLGKQLFAFLFVNSNHYFAFQEGYFEIAMEEKALLHTWSLSIEEQFYFFFSIVLVLIGIKSRVFLCIGLLSLVLCLILTVSSSNMAYFITPSRIWELLVGVYVGGYEGKGVKRFFENKIAAGLSMCALLIMAFYLNERSQFPGFYAILLAVATACLLVNGENSESEGPIQKMLSNKVIVFIGLISYPLYLVHWPVFALTKYLSFGPIRWYARITICLISLFGSAAVYACIEKPIRERRVIKTNKRLIFVFGGCFSFFVSIAFLFAFAPLDGIRYEKEIARRLKNSEFEIINSRESDESVIFKEYGDISAFDSILLWGDSHAMQYVPGIDFLCKEFKCKLLVATRGGYRPTLLNAKKNKKDIPKAKFNANVLGQIKKRNDIKAVILAGYWGLIELEEEESIEGLREICMALKDKAKLYFVLDNPIIKGFSRFYLRSFAFFGDNRMLNPESLSISLNKSRTQDGLLSVANEHQVSVIAPGGEILKLLDASRVIPFDENGFIFYDEHHLTKNGSYIVSEAFKIIFDN